MWQRECSPGVALKVQDSKIAEDLSIERLNVRLNLQFWLLFLLRLQFLMNVIYECWGEKSRTHNIRY